MTPRLPQNIEKIAKILPRLGSDFDGEIVATAKAIGRTLEASGASWVDFAQTVERGVLALEPKPAPHRHDREEERTPPTWAGLTSNERERWLNAIVARAHLSAWEMAFTTSIISKFHSCSRTEKQIAVLDRLLAKAFAEGVRI